MSLLNELNGEERLMRRSTAHQAPKRPTAALPAPLDDARSLASFLTPQVLKQAHRAWQPTHYDCRWCLQALVWVVVRMSWSLGQSEAERFQRARAFYGARPQRSRRPGQSWEGFRKALRRLPSRVLRALAAGVREPRALRWLQRRRPRIGGDLPLACDGSRLDCPRTAEREARLGPAGKDASAPTVYLSTLVLLPLGLLWSWRLGTGTASEHEHWRRLLPTWPRRSLIVADAGSLRYERYHNLLDAGAAFRVRMSSRAYLSTQANVRLKRFREGRVYDWPAYAQEQQRPPIRARLLRLRGAKADVWLLSSLDRHTLPVSRAGQVYRWRWRNEGLFRTYKRTLQKVKWQHRTVALVPREAEGSLLALQVLLALTAAQPKTSGGGGGGSPRRTLLRIRGAVQVGIARLGPLQWRR